MYNIPDKINMFNVYQGGTKHVGVSDEVKLPQVTEMTETIAGPGFLGEIDSPTHGIFSSMEMEIPFRTLFKSHFRLMQSLTSVDLTLRSSIQCMDGQGNVNFVGMRVVVRGRKKDFDPGKLKQGEGTGSTIKIEVTYLLIEIDKEKCLELDKINGVYRLYGVDQLAPVIALC